MRGTKNRTAFRPVTSRTSVRTAGAYCCEDRRGETHMHHAPHTAQIYTLFGGAYVSESHGDGGIDESRKPSRTTFAVMLLVALLGVTTAATAITASSRNDAP